MNLEPNPQNLWAKLVPFHGKEPVKCPVGSNEVKIEDKGRVFRKPTRETWIINLSSLYLKVGESWLETNQEKRLFGGEEISFCQNKEERMTGFDYIFCFMDFQSESGLKRNREDDFLTEFPNQKPAQKLVKVDNSIPEEEITCSICWGILKRCATLGQCGHNFCGYCLVKHLRDKPFCPLCKTKIKYVLKNSDFRNIIEKAVKNSPNLREEFDKQISPLQKDLDGIVYRVENGKFVFIGSKLDWKREEQGTLIFPNGEIYQCVWKNGFKEGEGVWIQKDGTRINGRWLKNRLQQGVEITFVNGHSYKGEVKDPNSNVLKFHGRGTFKLNNGDTYEGDFKDDVREGFGKYSYKNGDEYEGEWRHGEKQGFGTMKYSNGNIYTGKWSCDKREGNGVLTSRNGDKFEGTLQNDLYNGRGIYIWADGEEYEGNFTNSLRDGYGTMKYLNGDIFRGDWKKDKRHGKGDLTSKDRRRVEGTWESHILQPRVKIYYPNGDRYEGEVRDETFQKHGKGVLFFHNGGKYDDYWSNDKEIGQGKYTLEHADRKYEEFWEGGSPRNSIIAFRDGAMYRATWKEVKEPEEKLAKCSESNKYSL